MVHPFVLLPYKGKEVEIDVDLAPLIQKLWALGIDTFDCCQGDPGPLANGYISMDRTKMPVFVRHVGVKHLLANSTNLDYNDKYYIAGERKAAIRFRNDQIPGLTARVLREK